MSYTDNFVSYLLPLVTDLVSAEKMEMSEMLYSKAFMDSPIGEQNEIVTGVRNGNVMPVLKDTPQPESFPFVDASSCDETDCDLSHEFSSHKWEIGLIECRVGICLRTFNENFLKFFNAVRQTQTGDIDVNTALLMFISDKFTENLNLSTWRVAYFGDKSSGSVFFSGVDGIFTQMEANAAQVIDITQNDGGTFALQAITGEEVYDYLVAMYEKAAEQPWFDPSIMQYKVTRSMSIKLVSWLNSLGKKAPNNCECIDPAAAVARNVYMLEGLSINGVPVNTHNEFDSVINFSTELNGGGGVNARVNPHRAILTYRENVLIGTSETEALNSFDIWHSKDDNKVYLKGSSYVGGGVPLTDEYILGI